MLNSKATPCKEKRGPSFGFTADEYGRWEHTFQVEVGHTGGHPASGYSSLTVSEPDDSQDPDLRNARYASRALLCPWFPQGDPEHQRAKTFKAWWSRRKTVLTQASILSTLVFLVNAIGTAVLHSRYPDARLFEGDCATAAHLNSAIHVLINALSSLLLGASNLCMQLLSAPTRAEVDKAHAQRKWLDIGIPSIQNLPRIAWQRTLVWTILAVASLPLHVL